MIEKLALILTTILVLAGSAQAADPFATPRAGEGVRLAQGDAAAGRSAGRVLLTTNNLRAQRGDGSVRALGRHSFVYEGDTLVTGVGGMTQVRMNDGALLSLRGHTEFRIDRFNFDNGADGSERSFFSLLRGGLRTISGIIGQRNKRNYRVGTPVATIGIRGTHYGLRLCEAGSCAAEGISEDGLYGGVLDGAIAVRNAAGEAVFSKDEFFYLANRQSAPRRLLAPPGVVFGAQPDVASASTDVAGATSDRVAPDGRSDGTESVDAAGDSNAAAGDESSTLAGGTVPGSGEVEPPMGPIVPPDPEGTVENTVSGGTVAATSFLLTAGVADTANAINTEIVDAQSGSLIGLDVQSGAANLVIETVNVDAPDCAPCTTLATTATLVQSSVGGNSTLGVNWGRWSGAWTASGRVGEVGVAVGDLHFMYSDQLTPESAYNRLSGTFDYDYTGEGTRPTNHAGVEGVLNSASVAVDFGAQQVTGYSLDLSVAGDSVAAGMAGPGVSFSAATNGDIQLNALCSGPGCGNVSLTGRASTSFVGAVTQGRPEGLISSYSVAGSSSDIVPQPVGYNGTFLATPR